MKLPAGLRPLLLGTTALLPLGAQAQAPNAQPTGGQVVAGQASISRTAGQTTITQQSNRAAIDWQRFNVGRDQTVQFQQPSAGSWTLNRVTTPDPSLIAGRIQANGGVAIVNQSGIVFTGTASVNVGALIASAAGITNDNFMAGRMNFDGAPRPGARVENHGEITVAERGLAALVAPGVANRGTIRGRLARVALQGAETYTLDLAGDGLIAIDVTQAVRGGGALVTNTGTIDAPGGTVLLSAHTASNLVEDVVRQSGRVSAHTDAASGRAGQVAIRAAGGGVRVDGVVEAAGGTVRIGDAATARATVTGEVSARGHGAAVRGGLITVEAKDSVRIAGGAKLDASGPAAGGTVLVGTAGPGRAQRMAERTAVEDGAVIRADATQAGQGGTIVVNSTAATEMRGTLSARGGRGGGDGGFIEVSGQAALVIRGNVDVRAPAGRAGTFLIDPQNIIISDAAAPAIPAGDGVTGTLTGAAALDATTGVATATTGSNNDWLVITTDAVTGFGGGNITLDANRSIVVETGFTRTTAGDLALLAGQGGGPNGADIRILGGANISVNGGLTLSTARGAIAIDANLSATSVTLNASGAITQTGGTIQHRDGGGTALTVNLVAGGGLALGQGGNGSLLVAGANAGGALVLRGAALNLAGDVRATSVVLEAAGGITQSGAGTIRHQAGAATPLELTARSTVAGDVSLENGGNGAFSVGSGGTSQGNWRVRADENLAVGSALQATGAISLTATGALAVNAAVVAGLGQRVTLTAEDVALLAAVRAPAGEILIQGFTPGRAAFLGGDQNAGDPAGIYLNASEIGRLGAAGDAALRVRVATGGGATVIGPVDLRGRVATLQFDGAAGYDLSGGAIDVPRLVVRAGAGSVSATDAANRIDEVAVVGIGGAGTFASIASTAAGAGTLTVVTDVGPGGTTSGVSGFGSVGLMAPALRLDAPVVASGSFGNVFLTATAAGGIAQGSAGAITAASLTATAGTGGASIVLDAGGSADTANFNRLVALGAIVADGAITVLNQTPLAIGGLIGAKGDITLRAPTLFQAAGQIRSEGAGATILLAANSIVLTAGATSVQTTGAGATVALQPFSNDLPVSYGIGSLFEVTAAQLASITTDTISLRATGTGIALIAGTLDIGGVGLDLRGATVTQALFGLIRAARVSGVATAGDFALTSSANEIGAAQSITAAGRIFLNSAVGLTSGGLSAAGGTLSLTATQHTVIGDLQAGSAFLPGAISLTATGGGISLGTAAVTALGGGTITLLAAGDVTQAAGGAGALSAASLAVNLFGFAADADLRGTGNAIGVLSGNTPAGLRLASGTALAIGGGGLAAAGGAVAISAASIAVNAPISAGGLAVSLEATGAGGITQGAGARITAGTLTLRSAGAVTLDGGGAPALADRNLVDALGTVTVATDMTFFNAGALLLSGLLSSDGLGARMGALTLNTTASISQTAPIAATTVAVAVQGALFAGASLTLPGNDIGAFSGAVSGFLGVRSSAALSIGASSALTFQAQSDGALTLAGALNVGFGGITLTGAGITLGADAATSASIALTATGAGSIDQSAGRLIANGLSLVAGGNVTLANGDAALTAGLNQIGTLNVATLPGSLLLRNQGTLVVGGVVSAGGGARSTAVTLHAQSGGITLGAGADILAGTLTLTAPSGTLTLPASVSATSGITLSASTIVLGGGVTNETAGGILITSAGAISLAGNVLAAGQRVTILSDAGVTQGVGGITAAELVVRGIAPGTAAGSIDLGGSNAIASVVEMRSAGGLRLRSSGALSIDGAVVAGPDSVLRLETSGLLTVAATGAVTAGDPALLQLGQVSLWGFGVRLEGPVQAGDAASLIAGAGAMSFFDLTFGNVPGATITQGAGGTINARRLATIAPNTVDLTANGNAVDTIAHFGLGGQDVVFSSNRPLLRIGQSPTLIDPSGGSAGIDGIGGATGNVTLTAAALDIARPVMAATGATITLTTDDLAIGAGVVAPAGTVRIRPITAGTDVALGTGAAPAPGLIALSTAQIANIRTGTLQFLGDAGSAITLGTLDLRSAAAATRVARTLDLSGASVTQLAGAELSVERFTASVGGAVLLDQGGAPTATGNTLNVLGPVTATAGEIVIFAGGVPDGAGGRRAPAVDAAGDPQPGTQALRLAGAIVAGAGLTLRADGLALAGGTLGAGNGAMTIGTWSSGVNLVLGAADPNLPGLRLESALAGALSITGGITPTLTLLAPGGTMQVAGAFDLTAAGIGQLLVRAGAAGADPAGALSVATLEMQASAGGADLAAGTHAVDTLRIVAAAGGATGLTSTRNLTVLGIATAGGGRVGAVTLRAPSLSLAGAVRAGQVRLEATAAGAIVQSAPLDAGRLDIRALGGGVILTDAGNTIEHLRLADLRTTPGTAAGALEVVTGTNLSLHRDGTAGIVAGRVAITAASFGPAVAGAPQQVAISATGLGGLASTLLRLTATAGDLVLGAGSSITANGAATAATIELTAAGRIAASGTLFSASGGAPGSAITMAAGNAIEIVGSSIAAPSVGLTAGTRLMLTETPITAGIVTLRALAGDLVVAGAPGLTAISGGAPFTASASGGRIAISNIALSALTASLTATGGITISGGSLAAAAALALDAGGGGITLQSTSLASSSTLSLIAAGAIQANATTLAGAGVTLEAGAGVAIAGGGVTATAALAIEAGSGGIALQSTGLAAGGVLTLAGQGAIQASATALSGADVLLTAGAGMTLLDAAMQGADVTLAAGAGLSITGGGVAATGAVTFTAATAATLAGTALSGGTISLAAATGITVTASTISAAGQVQLATLAGALTLGGSSLAAGGALSAGTSGTATIAGTRFGGASIALAGGAGLTMTGGGATAATALFVASAGGAVGLTETSLGAGGALGVSAGGAITLRTTTVSGSPVSFAAGGDLDAQATGIQAGASLGVVAGGGITFTDVTAQAGAIGLSARSGVALAGGALTAAGPAGIIIDAGPDGALAVSGTRLSGAAIAFASGRDARFTDASLAAEGALSVTSGGALGFAGTVAAARGIALSAGAGATLTDSTLTAAERIGLLAAGPMALNAVILDAEFADFRTTGSLALGPVTARIGSTLVIVAEGGMQAAGPLGVTPRARDARLPAIVLDTRGGAVQSLLQAEVLPDLPGRPPGNQPTQVRSAPRSQAPGSFGASSSGTAGAMEVAIVAPDSAVFLLSDGARITGTIEAARLGVHGSGGSATLTGVLGAKTGVAAAEFADLTRPIAPASLQQYRLNGCVLSAVNCVVLPPVLVVPSRLAADVVIALERQRVRNPDVIVPDVAQEEF